MVRYEISLSFYFVYFFPIPPSFDPIFGEFVECQKRKWDRRSEEEENEKTVHEMSEKVFFKTSTTSIPLSFFVAFTLLILDFTLEISSLD